MKKLALCASMVLASFALANAQKSNVTKVSNLLIVEPVNYEEARALIAEAKQDPTTADDAKTWYYAGRIGFQQAYSQRNNWYIGQAIDADVAAYGLDEMFQNYIIADQKDGVVDKKGNVKYKQRKKIMADFKDMLDFYRVVGGTLYEQAKYMPAYDMFNDYVKITDLAMFDGKESVKVDSVYNETKYFAALAALQAEKKALAIEMLTELTQTDYKDNVNVYVLLADQHLADADTTKYVALLNEAVDRYPSSAELIGTLVNFYVGSGDYDKAIEYLDALIAKDPSNIEYLGVKAELLTQKARFEEAKGILSAAMEQNPDNARLTFLLGRAWAFEGDHIQEQAMDLTDNKAYNEAMKKAKDCYSTALGFFEKAKPLMNNGDSSYYDLLQNMKVLYLRLQNTDKYNEIDQEMKSL